jgi:hypothetical protein
MKNVNEELKVCALLDEYCFVPIQANAALRSALSP